MTPVNETEAKILRALADDTKGARTPDSLAREVGMSRQRLVPVVNFMEVHDLVIARRLHKQTSYAITQPGRNALRAYHGPGAPWPS